MTEQPNNPKDAVESALANPQVAPQEPGLNAKRDEVCVPAAKELIALIASKEDIMIGSGFTEDDAVEYYSDLYMEAVPILQKHNVAMDDIKYTFQIAMQALNLLQDRVDMTLELMYNQCTAHLWGVADTGLVTINDVDKQLRETIDQLKKKEDTDEQSTAEEAGDSAPDNE